MGFLFKNITISFAADLINGIMGFFGNMITNIFETIAEQNLSNGMIVNANNFTTTFSLVLVVFVASKTYLSVYVLETEGDQDSNVLDILYRASQATAIISCNQFIMNLLLDFSKAFSKDLSSSADVEEITTTIPSLVASAVTMGTTVAGVFIILLLIMVIAIVVFIIQAGIRGVELSLMKILFPIFAADLAGLKRERWEAFFTSYIITLLGYSLQLLCFRGFAQSLTQVAVDSFNVHGVTALGWLVLMIRSPKWLEKFCYSTGISRAAGSGARSVAQLAMLLKR